MVTIEQKLSLFSKLLQQDIKNDINEKVLEIEKEYEEKVKEHKLSTDKKTNDIVEKARKKAEIKQIELISKSKMQAKKDVMFAKEKYISLFIQHLSERVIKYTQTEEYKDYLENLVKDCKEIVKEDEAFILYLTQKDSESYGDLLKELFEQNGVKKEAMQIEVKDNTMLGGFILKGATKNIRLDLSLESLMEEQKEHIIQCIFAGIGEVGESVE